MIQMFVDGQLSLAHVLLNGQVVCQDRGRVSFQAEGSPSGWKAFSVSSPFPSFNRISTFRSASSSLVLQNREILMPSSNSFSAFSRASYPCSSSPTILSKRVNAFSKSLYSIFSLFLYIFFARNSPRSTRIPIVSPFSTRSGSRTISLSFPVTIA